MHQSSYFLKFDSVSFAYEKKKKILSNITFETKKTSSFQKGYVTALMGESGSGKSTILKLILGNIKDYSGKITMFPMNPTIAYVPQEPVLFEHLSPKHNSRYFEYISKYKDKFSSNLFEKLVKTLGLEDVLDSKSVLEISGGQRQRLSLLRALSIKPDFLLLDEPCTGLDAEVKKQFLIQLRQIVLEYELSVLYITHHHDEAKMIADDVIYLVKNEATGAVDRVIQGSISNFLTSTPSLEASSVFHFPGINILPFSWVDYKVNFFVKDSPSFLTFTPNDISLHDEIELGCEFEVVSSSPILTYIKIKGLDNIITANTRDMKNCKRISVSGECFEYDKNKLLKRKILLKNNQLLK